MQSGVRPLRVEGTRGAPLSVGCADGYSRCSPSGNGQTPKGLKVGSRGRKPPDSRAPNIIPTPKGLNEKERGASPATPNFLPVLHNAAWLLRMHHPLDLVNALDLAQRRNNLVEMLKVDDIER